MRRSSELANLCEVKTVLPTSFLPPVAWFVVQIQREAVIDLHEHFQKQTFRNRTEILTPQGREIWSIPLKRLKGIKTPTRDIQIADQAWKRKFLQALRSAYGRSAWFEYYADEIFGVIDREYTYLWEANDALFSALKKCGLEFDVTYSVAPIVFDPEGQHEYRHRFEPGFLWPDNQRYPQVFSDRFAFAPNLSILDLLFNLGPQANAYLRDQASLFLEH